MKITLTEDPTVSDALDIVFGYAIKQKQMTVDESEFLKKTRTRSWHYHGRQRPPDAFWSSAIWAHWDWLRQRNHRGRLRLHPDHLTTRKATYMKNYETIAEAKTDNQDIGRYDRRAVYIDNKPTILIGTTLVEEEVFETPLTKIFDDIASAFSDMDAVSPDYSSEEIAKMLITQIEDMLDKDYDIQIVPVFDGY